MLAIAVDGAFNADITLFLCGPTRLKPADKNVSPRKTPTSTSRKSMLNVSIPPLNGETVSKQNANHQHPNLIETDGAKDADGFDC